MRGPVSASRRSRRGADESGDVRYGAWLFVGVAPAPAAHPHPSLLAAFTTDGCLDPQGVISDRSYRSFSRSTASLDVGESTRDGVSGTDGADADTPCLVGERERGAILRASIDDFGGGDADDDEESAAAALPLKGGARAGGEDATPQQTYHGADRACDRACSDAPLIAVSDSVTDDDASALGAGDVDCGRPILSLWWRSAARARGTSPADADGAAGASPASLRVDGLRDCGNERDDKESGGERGGRDDVTFS
jgi:hypothetical protein